MRKNKSLIVIISIIFILAIGSAVFAYIFLMTDIFRSNQELFAKYISQNTETFQKITDFQTAKVYENLKNQNKYESNTNIKMIHSEGGEVSNSLNNLSAKLDIQKNNEEQYVYADGQILYEDEKYLEAEIIKQQQIYGIRFKDAAQQFITIEKDEEFEAIANDMGIEVSQLEMLTNIIDGTEETIVEEQPSALKDKYLNIITTAVSNGTFEKQRNAIITYNNVTTETNAYSVSLSSEQVESMLLEILNNIKSEAEILDKLQTVINKEDAIKQIDETINKVSEELEVPTIKITVFEQKEKTIRTVIEIGLHKIEIENLETEGEIITKINYSDLSDSQVLEYNFEIAKKNLNNQESFEIVVNAIEGEANYTINLSSQMQLSDNKIQLDTKISHNQDITTTSLVLENEVNIGDDFENTESLVSGNYILLNSGKEQKRKEMIGLVKELVSQKTNEKIGLLKEKIGPKDEEGENLQSENKGTENTEPEEEISQVEINKFNAKFEFYTGNEVSAENVKMLLDIVKNNLGSHEIADTENQENTESVIKLNIEKDVINEDAIKKVLEKINDNKKYKVLINYKDTNGLIDYITITEI